jgi:hypothetical protein
MILDKIKLIAILAEYVVLKGQVSDLRSQVATLTSERDVALSQAALNEQYRALVEDPDVQAAWNAAVAAIGNP